jgi:F0F1-type ATP synthase assembly protein I
VNLDRDSLLNSGRYLALGFQIGASIVGGLLIGYFLDDYFKTAPLFTLFFTLGGFVGALRVLLWSLKKSSR